MSSTLGNLLLAWYGEAARDLPWRHTRDPYAIWISEIMLQQTQVATVMPRYLEWMRRFPDITTLAAAPTDDVLKAWEGLGYYRRARFLHRAAGIVVTEHGGHFPDRFENIMRLPGIGRSTAGAIASICFDTSTPVLDGNVKRVLRRWHDLPEAADRALWPLAQQAIDASDDPASWNQAMMELGARICLPRNPDCSGCPVNDTCRTAFRAGGEAPAKRRPPVRNLHWQVELHLHDGAIWLHRRPSTGIWAGLWTPPIRELEQPPEMPACHIHTLTHRRLHLYSRVIPTPPEGQGQWTRLPPDVALPTGIRRLLRKRGLLTEDTA
ncbi:MAG TPA: A/G-specific adenine glycosylase [Mariprofundaceae bacterium]|nr:A/G-specific adenine glycosylase [Mariprofundaceae bacterium]